MATFYTVGSYTNKYRLCFDHAYNLLELVGQDFLTEREAREMIADVTGHHTKSKIGSSQHHPYLTTEFMSVLNSLVNGFKKDPSAVIKVDSDWHDTAIHMSRPCNDDGNSVMAKLKQFKYRKRKDGIYVTYDTAKMARLAAKEALTHQKELCWRVYAAAVFAYQKKNSLSFYQWVNNKMQHLALIGLKRYVTIEEVKEMWDQHYNEIGPFPAKIWRSPAKYFIK